MLYANFRCLFRSAVFCLAAALAVHPASPAVADNQDEKIVHLPKAGRNDLATEDQRILHLLNRAGFGPRPGDIERVRRMGIEQFLDEQLNPEQMTDDYLSRPMATLATIQMSIPETIQAFSTPAPAPPPVIVNPVGNDPVKTEQMPGPEMRPEQSPMKAPDTTQQPPTPAPTPKRDPLLPLRELQQAKILRAALSGKQLQEVMVDFWFNHFNVFGDKNLTRWMVTSYERDVIRPHALGKFQDLLIGMAQNPAMLYYLDNYLSQSERPPRMDADGNEIPTRRPGLNENFARELMELHTLGVDGGYTQQDVVEVARCFTGWTITPSPNVAFVFRPRIHDRGEKYVMGNRIPAGGGIEDGLRVLQLLARHPSTARHIALKLSRRFVSDAPPVGLVERVAGIYKKTDGDIREVVRTILTSPEFYSTAAYRSKIKSPFEIVVTSIRATAATTDGGSALQAAIQRMGGPLYLCQPPTGYPEVSSEWLSSSTLLERMNFAVAFMSNRLRGSTVSPEKLIRQDRMKNPKRPEEMVDGMTAALIHSEISRETRDALIEFVKKTGSGLPEPKNQKQRADQSRELITGLAALVLGSREFQMK